MHATGEGASGAAATNTEHAVNNGGTHPEKNSSVEEATETMGKASLNGNNHTFESLYKVLKSLRSGSFATVYKVEHCETKQLFAAKETDRRKLKPKDDANVFREVEILRGLSGHDGIINLIDFFESPDTFYVVMELAVGGDVFDRLAKRTVYTEREARQLARRMLETMDFLHSRGVVHRDLKAENLLLMDEKDDCAIKIADFGFATYYGGDTEKGKEKLEKGLTTRCGTPAYVAPEILLGVPYTASVDMWSCGVLMFIILAGYAPFSADDRRGLFRKIRAADFVFEPRHWDHISVDAKQLVSSFLVPDPDTRMDAGRALRENPWLNCPDEESLSHIDLRSSLKNMKLFNAKRKLRGAVHAVAWAVNAKFWNMESVTFSRDDATLDSHASSSDGGGGVSSVLSAMRKPSTKRKSAPILAFDDIYELTNKLQTGSFATVWEGRLKAEACDKDNGASNSEDHEDDEGDACPMEKRDSVSALSTSEKKFGIKVVNRERLKPKDDAAVLNEVAILQSLKHPTYVVALYDFFEERNNFYIVMELMGGGDVFDRVVKRKYYTELDARNMSKRLLRAVDHIHQHQVAHRDLKPQNLLLISPDDDSEIKIADFGFAKRVHTPNSLTTRCGTPTYVAPEIVKNIPHDHMVDMWSIGVIIYTILVGYPPFLEDNQKNLFKVIRRGQFEFFEEDWCNVSPEAKNLIENLLVVDPSKRMTARQALRSKWIKDSEDSSLSSRNLSGSQGEMRKTIARMKLQGAMHAVRWTAASMLKSRASSLAASGCVDK